MQGLEVSRIARIVVEQLSGVANQLGQGSVADLLARPQSVDEFASGEGLRVGLDEQPQQIEFPPFRFQQLVAAVEQATVQVDAVFSKTEATGFHTRPCR